MSKANVSTYKDNVVHVLGPSRLGGTIVDLEDLKIVLECYV